MINSYEIQLKIKNAPLLNMMRENGLKTAADLSRASGINQSTLGKVLNLSAPAYSASTNQKTKATAALCDLFGCLPEEIYPHEHLYDALAQNTFTAQVTQDTMLQLSRGGRDPLLLLEENRTERRDTFSDIIDSCSALTERQKGILTLRFQNGLTLKEVGENYGVTIDRIRQIIEQALRKMRNPKYRNAVIDNSGYFATADLQRISEEPTTD